jgi:hypothetical protein
MAVADVGDVRETVMDVPIAEEGVRIAVGVLGALAQKAGRRLWHILVTAEVVDVAHVVVTDAMVVVMVVVEVVRVHVNMIAILPALVLVKAHAKTPALVAAKDNALAGVVANVAGVLAVEMAVAGNVEVVRAVIPHVPTSVKKPVKTFVKTPAGTAVKILMWGQSPRLNKPYSDSSNL